MAKPSRIMHALQWPRSQPPGSFSYSRDRRELCTHSNGHARKTVASG
eukprot:CAMPEP_0117498810 /NCGR_PEP_ID=MMETSP0784-20121206/21909_1 /TAXON_ID=39447 /ORGANISM="" /LENGTH=46 /DNA_ID= /DNA_START= /DNA_END= /DNA_ORIENTATION=